MVELKNWNELDKLGKKLKCNAKKGRKNVVEEIIINEKKYTVLGQPTCFKIVDEKNEVLFCDNYYEVSKYKNIKSFWNEICPNVKEKINVKKDRLLFEMESCLVKREKLFEGKSIDLKTGEKIKCVNIYLPQGCEFKIAVDGKTDIVMLGEEYKAYISQAEKYVYDSKIYQNMSYMYLNPDESRKFMVTIEKYVNQKRIFPDFKLAMTGHQLYDVIQKAYSKYSLPKISIKKEKRIRQNESIVQTNKEIKPTTKERRQTAKKEVVGGISI